MPDARTMSKRKSLSVAGASLVAFVVVGLVANVSTVNSVDVAITFLAAALLLVFVVSAVRAAWMYWRDWYVTD